MSQRGSLAPPLMANSPGIFLKATYIVCVEYTLVKNKIFLFNKYFVVIDICGH